MFEISFNKMLLERAEVNEIIHIMETINQIKSGFFDKTMKLNQEDKVFGYVCFGNIHRHISSQR